MRFFTAKCLVYIRPLGIPFGKLIICLAGAVEATLSSSIYVLLLTVYSAAAYLGGIIYIIYSVAGGSGISGILRWLRMKR